jgi:hypothetical protein
MGDCKLIDTLIQDNIRKNQLLDTLDHRVNKAHDISLASLGDNLFINHYIIWSALNRHLQWRLEDFSSLVDNLHKYRLSQQWFSSSKMQQLHQNVLEFAAKYHVIPLTELTIAR